MVLGLLLGALLLAGCGAGVPAPLPTTAPWPTGLPLTTVNVARAGGLARTTGIEVLEQQGDGASTHWLTITDPALIGEIVAALDVELDLQPRERQLERYTIRFLQAGGRLAEVGYTPGAGPGAMLRGDGGYWYGQQVEPPPEFQRLMQEQLAAIQVEAVFPVPWPALARDAALAYLAGTYGQEAPAPDLAWSEEVTTGEGLAGGSTFQYTAGDWMVTVSFPVVPPEEAIFQVAAANEATGFRWEGQVDAFGQVVAPAGPGGQPSPSPEATEESGSEVDMSQTSKPAAGAPGTGVAGLVAGNSAFALDLYQRLRQEEGNLFFSPYSLSLALAMTYAGARGETERQMAEALHLSLPQEELHAAFRDLSAELAGRGQGAAGRDGKGFRLNIANALWGQEGYAFLPAFLAVAEEDYGSPLRQLDFGGDAEAARQTINAWADEETEGRIPNLIAPGLIDALTRLVLTNAIYFNAAWADPFEPSLTRQAAFHRLDGSEVDVPMMHQTGLVAYGEAENYQAVALPYDGRELSMIIVLPRPGEFEAFEAGWQALRSDTDQYSLCPGTGLETLRSVVSPGAPPAGTSLEAIVEGLEFEQVALSLPRFDFDSGFSLREALSALGMPLAFSPGADFSGMTGSPELFISEVVHKAFVAVDEAGTEAAAATAVMMALGAAPEQPVEMTVDRPFLFLIRDEATGAILFVGRVVDPS